MVFDALLVARMMDLVGCSVGRMSDRERGRLTGSVACANRASLLSTLELDDG